MKWLMLRGYGSDDRAPFASKEWDWELAQQFMVVLVCVLVLWHPAPESRQSVLFEGRPEDVNGRLLWGVER